MSMYFYFNIPKTTNSPVFIWALLQKKGVQGYFRVLYINLKALCDADCHAKLDWYKCQFKKLHTAAAQARIDFGKPSETSRSLTTYVLSAIQGKQSPVRVMSGNLKPAQCIKEACRHLCQRLLRLNEPRNNSLGDLCLLHDHNTRKWHEILYKCFYSTKLGDSNVYVACTQANVINVVTHKAYVWQLMKCKYRGTSAAMFLFYATSLIKIDASTS